MEDSAKIDYRSLGHKPPDGIQSLPDPRLHAVRLLRHANVHLSASMLSHESRPAVLNTPKGPEPFDFTLFTVDNVEASIRTTDAASRYLKSDLKPMIEWLEAEQREWGIQNVVVRATEVYARILLRGIGHA
jgi:hypothetical protein